MGNKVWMYGAAGMGKLVGMREQEWRSRDGRVGMWSKAEE